MRRLGPLHALLRGGHRRRDGSHRSSVLSKFGWTGPGYEYPLMWGLIMLAIALRGGGPYSLDRRLGREL
jgi:putative oxidoreductase